MAPVTVSTSSPLRASRVESEVVVPFLQTLITASVVGICLGLLAFLAGWRWPVAAAGVALTMLSMWVWRVLRSDRLLWQIERLTHHDLDGDGMQGEPPEFGLLNPRLARRTAAQHPLRDTGAAQRSLIAFVYLCASVERPTEEALGIPTGDRAGYVNYRTKLFDLGIAAWNDPDRHAAGWHLAVTTETAAALIEKHLV
jgi:hypothetical protein